MDVVLENKLSGYKQIALEKLENILLRIFGTKDLVIEQSIVRILDSFANMTWLKSKGFDKIYFLSSSIPPKRNKTLVFMIFSNLTTFKKVLDYISILSNSESSSQPDASLKQFHIIVVPHICHTFQSLIEYEGLSSKVDLYRFSWDFVKVDQNLYSLEIPNLFGEIFIKQDKSALSAIAHSLKIFNMIHKHPNLTFTCGKNAENLINMVQRMEKTRKTTCDDENSDFDAMVVIDRDVDYGTCLLTPVTYSGLMVELFDVKAGILNLEQKNKIEEGKLSIFSSDEKKLENEVKSLRMCGNSDELYTSNKYKHFSEVLKFIKNESKSVEDEKRKYSRDMKKMNIEQMKEFVEGNLPKVAYQNKILFKHLIICEKIVQELSLNFEKLQNIEEMIVRNDTFTRKQILSFIDENMATNAHKFNILRLSALFHLFCDFPGDDFQKLVVNYLNTFGHQHLSTFQNLHKAKLLPDFLNSSRKVEIKNIASNLIKKTQFASDAIKLKLIPENESKDKICPSYVFNGTFIPLISQLIHHLIKSAHTDEFKNKIGNLKIKIKTKDLNDNLKNLENSPIIQMRNRKIFVFVIGGITYAEVAACNTIESLTNTTIVLASDEITCGSNLIKSAAGC